MVGRATYPSVLEKAGAADTDMVIAVTKNQPISIIKEAINEGIYCFGENRVQEAVSKFKDFKEKYIPQLTQYLANNPIIPPLEWKRCIREITLDYPELLNIDGTEDNKLWPWYGELISDPKNNDKDASHVRYKTNFYRKFKKTRKDRYLSTCCGKQKMKIVYDCENNNP